MRLKDLIGTIEKNCSSFSKREGLYLYKNNRIFNVSGKSINGIYHIYGKIEEGAREYSSHIKINLKTSKVIGASCSCEQSIENSKHIPNYICKHNVAVVYKLYELLEERKKESNNFRKVSFREKLKLDIKIKVLREKLEDIYYVECRVGKNNTVVINSLEEFLIKYNNKNNYDISSTLSYNPERYYFNEEDNKILELLYNFLKDNKNYIEKVNGRYIKVEKKNIYRLLTLLINRKIVFNYEYVDYNSSVILEKLPLVFSLKSFGEELILKTNKKMPIMLDEDYRVFFYHRNIYLLTEVQGQAFKKLYTELKDAGEIRYRASKKVILYLVELLGNVAKEVILDEGTKKLISKYNMPYFYVEKQENEIKCNVKIKYGDTVVDILKDKGNCFFRDFLKEEKLKMELEKLGFFKKDEEFILKEDEEVQFNFLKKGLNYLKTIGIVNVTEGKNSSGILNTNMLKPTVEDINNKKYITFNNKYLSLEEVEEILQALKEGKKFYKTKRNYFLDFSDGGILSFFNLLDLLEIEKDKFKVDNREEFYLQDKNLKYISGIELIMESKNKLAKDVYEIPRDLKAKLREYQEEGFNWINNLYDLGFGGILADEMGLGKTLQVISFLLSKRNLKTLVVVPTSLLYNWKEEIIKFAPTLNFSIIHGDRTKREEILNNLQEISVVLTTYGVLKNDIDIFSKINFDICIIDEAQNIKNSKAQISKAVKMINSKFALALTGTPLENNLKELWSIFDFIMPGFLFDEETFKEKFILSGDEALHKLKKIIAPFILRRLKKDVLDELPDKIENKILVTMTKEQKKLYNSFIKEVKVKIKNQKDSITILSYLTRLRQLCLDPSIVFKDYKGGSAKLDKALEVIKDKSKTHKILLFSQFTKVLKSIEEALKKEKINSLYLDGEVLSKERINLVNKFNDNNESRVFLISTKAGGTGLNLTSADVVIHFDPWWNPAIENQATDRAHRIGQKNKVNVIKLIAKDTIEEKIDLLQQDKNELISKVIDGGDLGKADLLKLSNKELIDLF